jgi:two-component system cell cycle sensor histidine kinase/response regulator CckA
MAEDPDNQDGGDEANRPLRAEALALASLDLRQSEDRYRRLVEGLDAIVWEGDPKCDVESFVFTFVSPRAEEILGYSLAHWLEPGFWSTHIHPEDRAETVRACRAAIEDGRDHELEYRMVAADGRSVWIRDRVRVRPGADGSTELLHGVMVDVSQEKDAVAREARLEEELRQAQKMEAIGRLAGGIAHDFNNMLTAILGYSDLGLDPARSGDRRRELTEIRRAADRAQALTRQLLAFGRKQTLSIEAIDVNECVLELDEMLRRLIGEDIELVVDVRPRVPRATADRVQVQQVVLNLAVNARDAMPGGGTLRIDTAAAELETDELAALAPGRYVRIGVEDSGSGMDAETLARAFEPFFTTKPTGKGTGLGLSTVQGVAAQLGGHVAVRSAPGQGARFDVYLPAFEREAAAAPPAPVAPPVPPPATTDTILVVEDEPVVRDVVCAFLDRYGYAVVGVADGREALEVVRRVTPKVVVTDLTMPDMSGAELAERMRRDVPGVRVLYMSGYASDAAAETIHGERFIEKPFTPEQLDAEIRALLDD